MIRPRSFGTVLFLTAACLLCGASSTPAQTTGGEPDLSGFIITGWNSRLLNEPAGFLSVEPPAADVGHSFFLSQARVYLHGELDERITYNLKTSLVGGLSLLVADLTWRVDENLTLTGGRVLKPFGRDRSYPRHLLKALDWAVATLQVGRDLRYGFFDTGLMFSFTGERGFGLKGGIFNGAGMGATKDTDTGKNVVARAVLPVGALEVGAGISWLHLGQGMPQEGRDNLAWGIDAGLRFGGLIFEGEVMRADDWSSFDPVTMRSPGMWTATVTGVIPLPRPSGSPATELVVRVERFDLNEDVEQDEWYFLAPNLNISISRSSRLQAGLIASLPLDDRLEAAISGVVLWQANFF
jgi:hypothetical protein